MLVRKDSLRRHLARIHCSGLVKSAVFKGQYATTAQSASQDLIVVAPNLAGTEAFPEPVFVEDLGLFHRWIQYPDDDVLHLRFDAATHYLIQPSSSDLTLSSSSDWSFHFKTKQPNPDDASNSDESIARVLRDLPPAEEAAWLTRDMRQTLLWYCHSFKPKLVGIHVGPGGSEFVLTDGILWISRLWHSYLRSDEEYWVFLSRQTLTAVLRQMDDRAVCTFQPTGPDSFVAVRVDEYLYLLTPTVCDRNIEKFIRQEIELDAWQGLTPAGFSVDQDVAEDRDYALAGRRPGGKGESNDDRG